MEPSTPVSTSLSSSSSSASYTDVDGRVQPLLPVLLQLLSLTSTPYSASRLPATISAHSLPVSLLKTRRLMLLNKLRAKMAGKGKDSDWQRVEECLQQLSDRGAPVDRLITIVSYLSETQSKPSTTAAASAPPPAQLSTPAPLVSTVSATSSPSPALAVSSALIGRTVTAPVPGSSSRLSSSSSTHLSAEPTPARSERFATPRIGESSRSRLDEAIAQLPATERRRGGQQETGDQRERRSAWEEDDADDASAAMSSSSLNRSVPLSPSPDSHAVDVCYGDEISLQLPSSLYASLDPDFLPTAGPPPFQPSSSSAALSPRLNTLSPYPFLFTLTNVKNLADRSPVRLLDGVSLSADGSYLTVSPQGAVVLSPSASPSSRFTLYSGRMTAAQSSLSTLSFVSVRGCVKHGDAILLKGSTGLYLSDEDGDLRLVERPTPTSLMTLRRGDLPIPSAELAKVQASAETPLHEATPKAPSLSTHSLAEQEAMVVDDLLYALIGIDGEWVYRPSSSSSAAPAVPATFILASEVTDVSHRSLVTRLLPLCDHYVQLRSYIAVHSEYGHGCVQHALVASLSLLCKEYEVMIASLSTQPSLSLTQLSYHLSSPAYTLQYLSTLLTQTAHQLGGALLNVLHTSLLASGDPSHRSLLLLLLSSAWVPYFALLSSWLYTGAFSDQHHEFQIRSNASVSAGQLHAAFNDSYWDSRWSVDAANVPVFMAGLSERVLVTGKYLNVIRECGKEGAMRVEERARVDYSSQERDYAGLVEHAYSFASRALLSLLLTDYALLSHLASIKAYFFLAHGDWYTAFLDIAEDELSKSMGSIQRTKLQSLLSLALKSSRALHDPHHDLLTCALQPHSLMQRIDAIGRVGGGGGVRGATKGGDAAAAHSVSGLDAFTLSYDVTYPLTLLLSRTTLTKYQLLFRLLFNLRNTERVLSALWKRDVHRALPRQSPAWATAALLYAVRARMSAFISALLQHFTGARAGAALPGDARRCRGGAQRGRRHSRARAVRGRVPARLHDHRQCTAVAGGRVRGALQGAIRLARERRGWRGGGGIRAAYAGSGVWREGEGVLGRVRQCTAEADEGAQGEERAGLRSRARSSAAAPGLQPLLPAKGERGRSNSGAGGHNLHCNCAVSCTGWRR